MHFIKIANTVCLLKSLLNEQMYPKSTQLIISHIVSAVFTGHNMKLPECILLKKLTQSVFLNHCSMTKFTPTWHIIFANL